MDSKMKERRLTVEDLLDRIWKLEKQVDWLCRQIPHIGDLSEPEDAIVESALDMDEYTCPSKELKKNCEWKFWKDPKASAEACAECWKRESWKAISQETL